MGFGGVPCFCAQRREETGGGNWETERKAGTATSAKSATCLPRKRRGWSSCSPTKATCTFAPVGFDARTLMGDDIFAVCISIYLYLDGNSAACSPDLQSICPRVPQSHSATGAFILLLTMFAVSLHFQASFHIAWHSNFWFIS